MRKKQKLLWMINKREKEEKMKSNSTLNLGTRRKVFLLE